MLKLHSRDVVTNCNVKVIVDNDENNPLSFLLGIIVPNKILAIPLIRYSNKISISILYDTKMNELILHSLTFENGIEKASIDKGEKIIANPNNEKHKKIIIESDCILFEYVRT